MKYSNLIKTNKDLQASVNLEYDLNNAEKLGTYIPTAQSVKILGDFLNSYYYKNKSARSSVLIGPYGRGKSFLMLVLVALTSLDVFSEEKYTQKGARKIMRDLCRKIAQVSPEVGALSSSIVESDIRTLPVIVNSNSTDIGQSFLAAMREALERAGLENLLPRTHFDAAAEMISTWKEEYPAAYESFSRELDKSKQKAEDIYLGLKQYREEAYETFTACYPQVSAGAQFNPFTNMDVVKLYLSVADALEEQTPYKGITIIFDEFSKFLEANLDQTHMRNFKIIQDMAEVATRSGEKQIHFICITHKDILDYSSSDSFKTVEGRFNKVRFVESSDQSYELISNALIKTKEFEEFCQEHSEDFARSAAVASNVGVFSDLQEENFSRNLVYGCFPLLPLSAYALLHVSELVGQNERTLFTFLTKDEPLALPQFLEQEHEQFDLLTVDRIYDYFEKLFKKEMFNRDVHQEWEGADSAIRQADSEDQVKILKVMALMHLIRDDQYAPVSTDLKASLQMTDEQFDVAIRALQRNHLIFQRSTGEYILLTSSGIDVRRSVDAYADTKISRVQLSEALEQFAGQGYVMPRQYNDRFSMFRYFRNIYMELETFTHYQSAEELLEEFPADGLIIHLISTEPVTPEQVQAALEQFSEAPQIILCFSAQPFTQEELLRKRLAAEQLRGSDQSSQDPHFEESLTIFAEELDQEIQEVVREMFAPSSAQSSFANCTGLLTVRNSKDLNQVVSRACGQCYGKTPIVNNEMVNKRSLNAQNLKGRNKAVEWVLAHADDAIIPCMEGAGPEVSIFKSVYQRTGLDHTSVVGDIGLNEVLDIITDFVQKSEEQRGSFADLYRVLMSPPYGMRRGVIPLFVGYVLRMYQDGAVLYFNDREIELSAAALSRVNDQPENYQLLVEVGTADRRQFLDQLGKLFSDYISAETESANRVYTIVRGMQAWARALPEFTKKFMTYYENGQEWVINSELDGMRRDLLKFEINSRELLFARWPELLNVGTDYARYYKKIAGFKSFLDHHVELYRSVLTQRLVRLFAPHYQGTLSQAVRIWDQQISEAARKHVFDARINALITFADSIRGYDDRDTLAQLVRIFERFSLEDWNDRNATAFLENITDAVNSVNDFHEEVKTQKAADEGVMTIHVDGKVIEKRFAHEKISPIGQTMLNNLRDVLDEYNGAIDPDERLSIIIDLIRDTIH